MNDHRPILLVEDDPKDIELTLAALEAAGLANEVVVARDGEEALDYIARLGAHADRTAADPCVIFLDLKLPKIDGLEVLARIKGDRATRSIPVVMLTASREEADVVKAYGLGTNAYVVKPLGFDAFLNAIRDLGAFWGVINMPPKVFTGEPAE